MKISLTFPPVSYSYDIKIGSGITEIICGDIVKNYSKKKIILLTDGNINKLYGKIFFDKLKKSGAYVQLVSFPAGEKSKSAETKENIESVLIKKGFDRASILIALGGGVTGDLGGYVAATYMRGIPFIQIPTSLLAMVDSSIGGKVAINHPLGKNMIGVFYQPQAVFIDISMLKTLTDKEFFNGLSEVLKTALIQDGNLFKYIEKNKEAIKKRSQNELMKIISGSCRIKADVVMQDEKETGLRKLLNFGHTTGHAIEILSGFRLPHGFCVSIGMNIANIISYKTGNLSFEDYIRVNELLKFFELPTKIPKNLDSKEIVKKLKNDKKSINGIPYFSLLNKIGSGSINHVVEENLILESLEEAR